MARRRTCVSMVSTTALAAAAALFPACGPEDPGNAERGGERVAVVAEPLSVANDSSWHWYQGNTNGLPDLRCMDNSETGFGMSVPANWNKKVLVWLDGGGVCWDAVTCTTTPGISPHVTHLSYGQNDFNSDALSNTGDGNYDVSAFNWSKPELQRGVLNRTSIANPFQAYAYVFVPYCTGDAHAGNNWDCVPGTSGNFRGQTNVPCTNAPGIGDRKPSGMLHLGLPNTTSIYAAAASALPGATNYVLAGGSAGGDGAIDTYAVLRSALPSTIPITVISDAGDPLWSGTPDPNNPTVWSRQGYFMRENPDGSQRPPSAPLVEGYAEDYAADAWGTSKGGTTPVGAKGPFHPAQSTWINNATTATAAHPNDRFGVVTGSDDYAYAWLAPLNGPPPPFPLFGNGGTDGVQPNLAEGLDDFKKKSGIQPYPNTSIMVVTATSKPPLTPACSPSCLSLRKWQQHHTFLLDDTSVWDATVGGSGVAQYLRQLGI